MPRGRPPIGSPEERAERRRRLNRERQARQREREDKGGIFLQLPIDHMTVNLMLEAGAVDAAGSRSRKRLSIVALRILNNALVTAVAAGRKFSFEQEEQHARENTKGDRYGLRQHLEDPAEAGRNRRCRTEMAGSRRGT
ncbi:MAG: hypothetical protein E5V29_08005 [Mesorhizobium sp.]|nr:MAG: hypothetical protein E5V29_08005 [Mesorhizobium sp.]